MPRFDGTGPRGQGPFTGRGDGFCATPVPEDAPANDQNKVSGESLDEPSATPGAGFVYRNARRSGMGLGMGLGRRRRQGSRRRP